MTCSLGSEMTNQPGCAQVFHWLSVFCSKLGSVLQRAFYGASGRVTLYEQRNFTGHRLDLTTDCQRLADRDFPERCNSVKVESGAWVGYEHESFRGRQYLWDMYDQGEYQSCDKWCSPVDTVSSVRNIRQDETAPRIQLFERPGFSGKKAEIQDDIPNLMTRFGINRIASARILGAVWVLYQEPNYRGPHYILERRDYSNYTDWAAQGNTVGSLRRVRFS
ncbi:crystallin beta gamma X [Erpetoichthys calabaricus]|uniref:crystallin beta gamma X n=1 Tax=Erpetoichthys calabaricus TaxID=27687 RepID=UPI0022343D60|nr:crystallin beta gamma X [Erpetoichthys calabaricus]